MSITTETDAQDIDFPTDIEYNRQYAGITVATTDGSNYQEPTTHYGGVLPLPSNEDEYYDEADSLVAQKLILSKEFKSPYDLRYKTDYFPRSGQNAGKSQSPRYMHTVDDEQNIVIKFAEGFKRPRNDREYYLEVTLVTVPRMNQYYIHVNKFQLSHTDSNVLDENPCYVLVTPEHFQTGEMKIKLVAIKTHKNELKNIRSLPLFNGQTSSEWVADCQTANDLKFSYELSYMKVAFSLGYKKDNGQFIRFPNTTVISNDILEKVQPPTSDMVTCPQCSHNFNSKEAKQTARKRSASSSNVKKKKRPKRTEVC